MKNTLSVHREKTSVFLSLLVMCLLSVNFVKSHVLSEQYELRFLVSAIILLFICLFFRFRLSTVTPLHKAFYRISLIMAFWSFCFFLLPFANMTMYLIPAPGFYFLCRVEAKKGKVLEDVLAAGILMSLGTFLYLQQLPLQAVFFPDLVFDGTGYFVHSPVIILIGLTFLRLNTYSEWKGLCLLGILLSCSGLILGSWYMVQLFWPCTIVLSILIWLYLIQIYFFFKYSPKRIVIRLTGIDNTAFEQLCVILYFICAAAAQVCIIQLIFTNGLDLATLLISIAGLFIFFFKYQDKTLPVIIMQMAVLFFFAGFFSAGAHALFWSIPIGGLLLFSTISRFRQNFAFPIHNWVFIFLAAVYYLLIIQFNLLRPSGILYILFPLICWSAIPDRPFAVPGKYHFVLWPAISFIVLICLCKGVQKEFFIAWALLNIAAPLILCLFIRTKPVKAFAAKMRFYVLDERTQNIKQTLLVLSYISAAIGIAGLLINLDWYIDKWLPVGLTAFLLAVIASVFTSYALKDRTLFYVKQAEIFFWLILALVRWKLDIQETLKFGSPADGYFLIAIAFAVAGIREVFKKKIPEFAQYFQKTIQVYSLIGWLYLQVLQFLFKGSLTGEFHHAELSSILMAVFNVWLSKARINAYTIYTVVFINVAVLIYFYNVGFENLLFYIFPSMTSALILTELFKDKLGQENAKKMRLFLSLILCGTASFYNIMDFNGSVWFPVAATLISAGLAIAGVSVRIRIFLYLGITFFIVNAVGVIAHIIINQPPENITLFIGVLFLLAGIFFTASFLFFQMKRKQIIERYHQITNELKTWQ